VLVLLVATLALVSGLVLTQQPGAGASTVLTILDGSVTVARGASDPTPASDGDLLVPGDRVRTMAGSHAVVTFFDGSTIEVEPATTIEIEVASARPDGSITIQILQSFGRTWASVQELTHADSRFELRTPTTSTTVRGTGLIVEVLPDGTTTVQTIDGAVEVTAGGATVVVPAGLITTVPRNAPPTQPAPAPPPRNRLRFGVRSPAYLAVVDPFGRTCGVALPGPTVVRQTPACLATAAGVEPQVVDLPNAPAGTYQLVLFPAGPGGEYTATATGMSGDAITFDLSVAGTITGGRQGASLDVMVAADGTLTSTGITAVHALDRSPIKAVLPSPGTTPTASLTPDVALFAPLVTPAPSLAPSATAAATPAPVPTPAPTSTPAPILLPEPTAMPPPSTPAPTATPSGSVRPGRARTPRPHCPPPKCTSATWVPGALGPSLLAVRVWSARI
jgi:hypothetical protein